MTVWLLEKRDHSATDYCYYTAGVYATREAAIAAHPEISNWKKDPYGDGWTGDDYDGHAFLAPHEVKS
jgi:hypothetical protein